MWNGLWYQMVWKHNRSLNLAVLWLSSHTEVNSSWMVCPELSLLVRRWKILGFDPICCSSSLCFLFCMPVSFFNSSSHSFFHLQSTFSSSHAVLRSLPKLKTGCLCFYYLLLSFTDPLFHCHMVSACLQRLNCLCWSLLFVWLDFHIKFLWFW